ncbi:MAG: endopeptidase La [Chloroflexi bacterium]|nr:endopeptidase La [Chloroflexota bacterium]
MTSPTSPESTPAATTTVNIPDELPLLPSGEAVVFPGVVVPLITRNPETVQLIEDAFSGNRLVAIFAERMWTEDADPGNFFSVGSAAMILRVMRLPDGGIQALLQGLARVRLDGLTQTAPYVRGRIAAYPETHAGGIESDALARKLVELFHELTAAGAQVPKEIENMVAGMEDRSNLADFITANLSLPVGERQEVLETADVQARMERVAVLLSRELEVAQVSARIQGQVKDELDKRQKDFYLREQLKAIRKELGENEDENPDLREFRAKLEALALPPEASREAERELERLSRMPTVSAEYIVARSFLEWMISLPWRSSTADNLDLRHAAAVLDEDHYSLDKVKSRILDYLAVRKLKPDSKAPILCFAGPPGVGKTSLGGSIARALGRKFVRMSLGGVRDEAEIRGHRRTYVGALPGRVIQGLRRAEANNPVILLDEIDKLGHDFRGDPAAALLEVLDPQQNHTFVDHYLDVPFDLTKVLFITTANVLDGIPPALRDRMEIIELAGYTEREKLQIARRYLAPRQTEENGLTAEGLTITEGALTALVRDYTREAGVRNLEREIAALCRRAARRAAECEGAVEPLTIDAADLRSLLGQPRFHSEQAGQNDEIGVAAGLAVTAAGGDVLFVEAVLAPGKGVLTLTGSLGDVMQESARTALTYVRSRAGSLGMPAHGLDKQDLHIHVPAGAIPKDGPSAGVTLAMALLSAVSKREVASDVAMTGEITLRGKVLPVGGVKEKVLAAHRAGMRRVIIPKANEKDLEEIPAEVRADLELVLAAHLDDVVAAALREPRPRATLLAAG